MHNETSFSGVCLPGGGGAVGADRQTTEDSVQCWAIWLQGWSLVRCVSFVGQRGM